MLGPNTTDSCLPLGPRFEKPRRENFEYLVADEAGLAKIDDETIDAIYSYAVAQHLTDEVFEIVLENCRQKLRRGGKLILHIQLNDGVWQPEKEWRQREMCRTRDGQKLGESLNDAEYYGLKDGHVAGVAERVCS